MGRKFEGKSTGIQFVSAALAGDAELKKIVTELRDEMSKNVFGVRVSIASAIRYACEKALADIKSK